MVPLSSAYRGGWQQVNTVITVRFLICFLLFGSFAVARTVFSQDENKTGVAVGTKGIMAQNGRAWNHLGAFMLITFAPMNL